MKTFAVIIGLAIVTIGLLLFGEMGSRARAVSADNYRAEKTSLVAKAGKVVYTDVSGQEYLCGNHLLYALDGRSALDLNLTVDEIAGAPVFIINLPISDIYDNSKLGYVTVSGTANTPRMVQLVFARFDRKWVDRLREVHKTESFSFCGKILNREWGGLVIEQCRPIDVQRMSRDDYAAVASLQL